MKTSKWKRSLSVIMSVIVLCGTIQSSVLPVYAEEIATTDMTPSMDTTTPTTDTTEPTTESAPSTDTTKPTTESAPSTDTTEPTTESAPSTDTTEPTTDTTSSTDTTPSMDTTEPTTDAIPTTNTTEPATESASSTDTTSSENDGTIDESGTASTIDELEEEDSAASTIESPEQTQETNSLIANTNTTDGEPVVVASGNCGSYNNITWNLYDDGILKLIGSGSMMSYYSEKSIPWIDYKDSITSVEIGKGIKNVGYMAFYGFSKITSVTLPDSLTSISQYAFADCYGLTSLELPDSVTFIGTSAFRYCTGLTSLKLPNRVTSFDGYAFNGCTGLTEVTIPSAWTSIPASIFASCTNLKKVNLENITYVGESAFSNCKSLTGIDTSNITSYGDSAFYGCSSLTDITLNENLTRIGNSAFSGCTGVTFAFDKFPDTLTTIGNGAFSGCTSNNKEVVLPENLTSLGYNAFANTGVKTVQLKSKNLTVQANALTYGIVGSSLKEVTIGSTVESLDGNFIAGIKVNNSKAKISFEKPNEMDYSGDEFTADGVTIPAGTYHMVITADSVVYQVDQTEKTATILSCPKDFDEDKVQELLDTNTITSGGVTYQVNAIGENTFSGRTNLTAITIPANIKSIGATAFSGCTKLAKVNGKTSMKETMLALSGQDTSVGLYTFLNTALMNNSADYQVTKNTLQLKSEGEYDLKVSVLPKDTDAQYQDDALQLLTGQYANISVSIDGLVNNLNKTLYVYFQFEEGNTAEGDGTLFDWPLGEPQHFESDGNICGTFKKTTIPHCYRLELTNLTAGSTLHWTMSASYKNGTSGGGSMLTWMELGESETQIDSTTQINKVDWDTQPDVFPITKTDNSKSVKIAGNGTENGLLTVQGLSYKIAMTKEKSQSSYGKDYMSQAVFQDILKLPAGFSWRTGLINAINDGKYEYTNGSFYVTVDEAEDQNTYLLATIAGATTSTSLPNGGAELSVSEDNQIVVSWTYKNLKNTTQEITVSSYILTYGDQVITAPDVKDQTTCSFKNQVTVNESFNYSEDVVQKADAETKVTISKADFQVTKTSNMGEYVYMGTDKEFTITLSNSTSMPYTGIGKVEDPVPDWFYIKPENMMTMFTEDDYGKNLTITIQKAILYEDGEKSQKDVTASDGKTYTIDRPLSGIDPEYEDTSGTSSDAIKARGVTITIGWSEDGNVLQLTTSTGETCTIGENAQYNAQYKDIDAAFRAIGYAVTSDTQYTCTWNLDDFTLWSGQECIMPVRSSVKTSFMKLTQDQRQYYMSYQQWINLANYAKVYDTNGNLLKQASSWMSCIYKDWNLTKSASIDGKTVTSSTNIAPGDVVTYTATITQMYGVDAVNALPLVDRMQGGQILLVPVLNNAALRNRGLETTTVGKLQYYILNQPGTYEKVTIGGYLTDHVEVTASASGLDTRIYWYLHVKKNQRDGSQNYSVTYYSLVDPNKAGLENSDARYTLTNKVWLGDDETHRLYDICYLYGYILQIGKNIVTNAEDSLTTEHNPDKDELAKQTVIDEGEKVTYRLMIGAIGDSKVTIPGSAIYDTLPGSIGNYWSEDNISITYVPTAGSTCTVTGGDSWYIENDAKNTTGKTQQTIRWGSDFRAQVEGTLYIYVTLQFPKDTENSKVWEQYAEIYGGDGLTNTWHVYDLTDSVYHVLKIPAQVKLQKGVVDSGNSSEEDSLLYYSNSSYYKNTVTYYVSVYNSGKSRVYLSKIQDVLPEGFTFNSLYNCDYSAYASSNAKYYNSLVTIKNGSAKATYKSAAVSVGTKTVNGREVVTFNLSNSYRASSTRTLTGSISYDQTQSRCYLLPGEAVVIAYSCYTNKYEDTEDVANNVVTMDYYDYAGAGMTADQDSTIELNNTTKIHNDGDFEICSTEEMAALGVDTTGKSDGTSWLTSEVSLQRGKIVPGIQKACMVEQASTTETIGWTVTGYNSGNGALRDYTYTDIMMYPYQFTGTVSYKISQETAKGSSSVKANLFQIIDRDEQSVTIQYSTSYEGSRYNTTPTVVMQMDGDPVTISSYYFGLIDVSIGHDSDQNEVLSVRFKDTQYAAIPANGTGTLTVYTNNVSNLNENKIFINQCYLTPNEQEFENSEVSQGTYTTFDLPSDEDSEKKPSVVSEAQVGVSYGYATKSVKTVTELTENGKSASSNSATNYIVLSNGEDSTFRYDLEVENNGGNSLPQDMNLMVMIDNLPEVGDHTTFYKEYARYSDFQVDFADPEELNPVVTVKTADGKSKTLSSKQYTLQFSKQTDLNFADNTELWQGQAVGTKDGWYTLAELEANNLDLKDMRTFRLVIDDSEETGLMPAKSTVSFGFNAVVHKDGEKIPGASEIAWNSFGYLYQIGTLKLQAAPLNVGVKIAGVPHLVKNLVDSQKKMYVTDEDETFRFLICKGSITQINSQSTETDKMKWLTDMEIPFTVAEITVPKGSSGSDAIPLDHMKVCTYDAETGKYQETEQDWIWSDKATYTVTELLQEGEDVKYTFGNINSNKLNQYIFTFDKSTSIHLTATNIRKEWDIQLLKTDSNGKKKLSGAVFGLYSKKQTDQLAEDAALPEKLNVQPEWSITNGEDTWYLMDIQTTDQDGQIQWSKLTEDEYYVLELQAPMGYRLGKDPGQVVKRTAGTEAEQVNVVNASIFQLPHAGGMGTGLFTISGLCLIAGGLLYMWLKRKKKHE